MSFTAKRKKSSTTNLPTALRDELGIGENGKAATSSASKEGGLRGITARGGGRGVNTFRGSVVGRKEARKAERHDRKASRAKSVHKPQYQKPRQILQSSQPPRVSHTYTSPSEQDKRPSEPAPFNKGKAKENIKIGRNPSKQQDMSTSRGQRKHVGEEESTPLQRLMARGQTRGSSRDQPSQSHSNKRRRVEVPLTSIEKQEEDEIAWLEAQLGVQKAESSKKKKVAKKAGFAKGESGEDDEVDGGEDGLDDLLEDLDKFYPGMYDGNEASELEEEDLDSEDDDELNEEQDESTMDKSGTATEEESDEIDGILAEGDSDFSQEEEESGSNSIAAEEEVEQEHGKEITPDVQHGAENVSGRYVPPALRRRAAEAPASDSEELQKLRRQAKGLLNRLGEGNIESIVMEITESLYRQYSRAEVTQAVTVLVIQTVSSSSNLVETFVVLHAAFIASLHRIVGLEFGSHFLQKIVETWLKYYNEARHKQNNDEEGIEDIGKESKNLIVLLANLYNLGVVACPLVFDIIKLTLGIEEGKKPRKMTELDVELLLKVVKTSGPQLRHDDPTSLKTIVQLAHGQQMSDTEQPTKMSSRSKFMLEALEDLKNNRSKAMQNQGLEQQSIGRMKKYLAGLSRKRTVRTQEPLRVGLKDLQDVDKRGKWWLVGAAWSGYDFGEKEAVDQDASKSQKIEKVGNEKEDAKKEALLQIARQHGMNTSIRQSIFVILISSQDYLEALEKLQLLKFKKDTQRREIIRVLLHCIGSETNYNPYYVVLASRLAVDDIGTRFTLQYSLWDFLRGLGEKQVGGRSIIERREDDDSDDDRDDDDDDSFPENVSPNRVANIARAYGWWFAKGALNLSAMKVIDFTNLKSLGIQFLQQVLVHLLLSCQTSSPALTLALSKALKTRHTKFDKGSDVDEISKQDIESVFVKGTLNNVMLCQGLLFFFERYLRPRDCIQVLDRLGTQLHTKDQLVWARSVAKVVVKAGAQASKRSISKMAEM